MNSRLTVAAHVLGMIAFIDREQRRPATSDELAASVGTNPVVVRRILSQLKAAGLVDSRRGAGGGTVLARDPKRITLRQAYEAVEGAEAQILGRHAHGVGSTCRVAPVIVEYLESVYAEVEATMLERLDAVTVDAMSREIVDRIRRRATLRPRTASA